MSVSKDDVTVVLPTLNEEEAIGRVIEDSDRVFGFREKRVFSDVWVNAGIYVLDRSVRKYLPERGDIERWTFPRLVKEGLLGVYRLKAYWRTIDTLKDLQEIEKDLDVV